MTLSNSTQRFSDRVDNYVKYRPRYPAEIIDFLRSAIALTPEAVVGDVGSGTGFLAELFLQHGNHVIGIEPNAEMRAAGEAHLRAYAHFASVDGTSESTTLANQSVDLIVAGQAFHWFDPARTRAEFARILRPGGQVVLVWNSRRLDVPFMQAYEKILHHYADNYNGISEHNVQDENIAAFYAPQPMTLQTFQNVQVFDFTGLTGRALSSSYSPGPSHPMHRAFLQELQNLYEQHQVDGKVQILYTTRVYWGML